MDRSKIPTLFQKTSHQKDEKQPFEGEPSKMPLLNACATPERRLCDVSKPLGQFVGLLNACATPERRLCDVSKPLGQFVGLLNACATPERRLCDVSNLLLVD